MNFRDQRSVRFQELDSERTSRSESQLSFKGGPGPYLDNDTMETNSFLEWIRRYYTRGSEGISSFGRSFNLRTFSGASETDTKSKRRILDPQGSFLQRWNKIFVVSCVIAVYLDPLFFYIPVVDRGQNCLFLDKKLQITACVLRSLTDIFYVLHIIFQFRTGFICPLSRVLGRGVLVEDLGAIAKRYLSGYFLVDILAVLPLPQVVILIVIPELSGSVASNTKNVLRMVVLLQYVPRVFRMYPLYKEVTRTSGIITQTAWAGAAFNLFLYMLASHIFGATWYLLAIEREDMCWRAACKKIQCNYAALYCENEMIVRDNQFLNTACPIIEPNTTLFNFGLHLDALKLGVVDSTSDFPQKLLYCLWWGLRSLSSLGQNLETSTYVWEIIFAVCISIFGLVLFSLLIGNMQTYLQSNTIRLEEMRVRRRDAEQWMSHRLLPENLRERIRRYEQYKWQETRGVDEEQLLRNLPKDLRRDIKRHLCLALLMRVPMFEIMDEQLLDAMCDRLKPVLFTTHSYIIREGDPVDEMLFIMRGKLLTMTTNGGRTGFLNSDFLKAGDFCGEELLTWALVPQSSSNLPTSTRTVQALKEVEAFALKAEDLKFVASQFRRLHSKKLRHTFRFYSQQWKTWAACFIQAAWRRYWRKKQEESLHDEENRLKIALAQTDGPLPSFGATIYASRFAAKILRPLGRSATRKARLLERMPPILLQKPEEPDFFAEDS